MQYDVEREIQFFLVLCGVAVLRIQAKEHSRTDCMDVRNKIPIPVILVRGMIPVSEPLSRENRYAPKYVSEKGGLYFASYSDYTTLIIIAQVMMLVSVLIT